MHWPFRSRTRPWRLLKALVVELRGIRVALEHQNRLWAAADPDAARWAEARDRQEDRQVRQDSAISYVDPVEILLAEDLRERTYRDTGRWLTDDELVERLEQERALGGSAH